MALTPTTWDAGSVGSQATISGGGLVYETSNYYDNAARTVFGTDTGSWYWELTLTTYPSASNVRLGVDADSASESGFTFAATGDLVQGDVLGFAFNSVAGTLAITRNGAAWRSLSSVTRTPGSPPAWGPAINQVDAFSGPVQITANFGASAFTYSAPGGSEAGFGSTEAATQVTGLQAGALGTPTIDYPPVAAGFKTGALGTPAMTRVVDVAGLRAGSSFGGVILKFDQTVLVDGFRAGRFGWVTDPGGVTSTPTQVAAVQAVGGGALGAVVVLASISPAVSPVQPGRFGQVRAALVLPVVGLRSLAFGATTATLTQRVSPIYFSTFGVPGVTVVQPSPGFKGGRFGGVGVTAGSAHGVFGFSGGALGAVAGRWTYPVLPLAGRGKFGRTVLGGLTC